MAKHFTDQTFQNEVLNSALPSLVEFYAEWCGPCKMMAPIIEELVNEYSGKVEIGKMDVDANPETPGKYGISSIPTFIFFKNGQEVSRTIGYQAKDVLVKKLEELNTGC